MLVWNCHQLFFGLKGGRVRKTRTAECFWKSPSVSSGPILGAKSPSVPQLLFSFHVLTWPTAMCLVLHYGLSAAYGTVVWDRFVCQRTLNEVILLRPAFVPSKHMFFLSHVAVLATVMSSRHLHSANDMRSRSLLFTRTWTASGDSWKYLKSGQVFKWYSMWKFLSGLL